MITLNIHPSSCGITWNEFIRTHSKYSIALDGYVKGGPKFDPAGPFLNFNHHEEVDRLATRSTSAQVLMSLRQGLRAAFFDDNVETQVHVNDCDEDVCLAWYLLHNAQAAENTLNPKLNKLVFMEDMMDTTSGSYPFSSGLTSLSEMAWIFQPYKIARKSGELDKKSEILYRNVIDNVELRINDYLAGNVHQVPIDTSFNICKTGDNWALINEKECGEYYRLGLFSNGIHAYVSYRDCGNGKFIYTIGRMSVFIPFDIPGIISHLNNIEKCQNDLWGGGDVICGSPRVNGSKIEPLEMYNIIQSYIKSNFLS